MAEPLVVRSSLPTAAPRLPSRRNVLVEETDSTKRDIPVGNSQHTIAVTSFPACRANLKYVRKSFALRRRQRLQTGAPSSWLARRGTQGSLRLSPCSAGAHITPPSKCKYSLRCPWVLTGVTLGNALGIFLLARCALLYI